MGKCKCNGTGTLGRDTTHGVTVFCECAKGRDLLEYHYAAQSATQAELKKAREYLGVRADHHIKQAGRWYARRSAGKELDLAKSLVTASNILRQIIEAKNKSLAMLGAERTRRKAGPMLELG